MDDQRILQKSPLPISQAYRRYRNAVETRDRHDAAYYLFEVYLKYLASMAISLYVAGEGRDHRVNVVLKGLARPSLGEWLRFLRECVRFLIEGESVDPGIKAISTLLESRKTEWPAVVALFNAMRSLRAGADGSDKQVVSLGALLDELVAYRNRVIGHAANLSKDHYEKFGRLFAAAFAELLERSTVLTVRRLVCFDAVKVEAGRVECGTVELMGETPDRRDSPHVVEYGKPPPEKGLLYLLSESGGLLCLDPLLIFRGGQVFVLNDAQGALEYLSYSSGERCQLADLGRGPSDLFRKILGYEVDDERLSQIGDEVAAIDRESERTSESPERVERRLGDYRIIRELGRGGMGTVFEAHQESLGRKVALKVLPGNFALDPQRLERFRREARTTARIHHPNIIPVYDVGEADGTYFYSMEYIDGAGLDDLLAAAREAEVRRGDRSGSSTTDAGYIATTVTRFVNLASGLGEAHRAGLVHRDVKPSNVLVDKSGRCVLVDFGLVHEETAPALTRSGEMVGTLSYMSPEQVSRSRVDARSDVFSLGVTLYEALTLRLPFKGGRDDEVQRAILFDEPLSPRKLNPKLSRDIETVILHALEKEPRKRYGSGTEFAEDLQRAVRGEDIHASPQSAISKVTRRAWRHKAGVTVTVFAIVLAVVVFQLIESRKQLSRALGSSGVVAHIPKQLTSAAGSEEWAAWSPDDSRLIYSSEVDGFKNLFVKTLSDGRSARLTFTKRDEIQPVWLAGDEVVFVRASESHGKIVITDAIYGFYSASDDLWKRSLESGEEKRLLEKASDPSYSMAAGRIAYQTGLSGSQRIWTSSTDGGLSRQVTRDESDSIYHTEPSWSPDGSKIAFRRIGTRSSKIHVVSVDSGEQIALTEGSAWDMQPSWCPTGKWVYFASYRGSAMNIWRIPVSPAGGAAGPPEPVTFGGGNDLYPALASDGRRLVFSILRLNSDLWKFPVDPARGEATGPAVQVVSSSREDSRGAWSPDMREIAFNSDRDGDMNLYVYSLEDGSTRRLTHGPGGDYQASWAPREAGLIAFFSARSGNPDIWTVRIADGELRRLTRDPSEDINPFFSPDGTKIAFMSDREKTKYLYVMNADGTDLRRLQQQTTGGHFCPWFPDGESVTCGTRVDGKHCFVRIFLDGRLETLFSEPTGGGHASFSRDPTKYMDCGGHKTVQFYDLTNGEEKTIFEFEDSKITIDYPVWSPDGKWVLVDRVDSQGGDVWMIDGLTAPAPET